MSFHACCSMEQSVNFYDLITVLNFSSDGHYLVVGFIGGNVAIVDSADMRIQKKICLYDKPVSVVALDENDLVVGYSDGRVQLKSLSGNSCATFKEQSGVITSAVITPLSVVTGSSDGSVCVRNKVDLLLKKFKVSAGVSTMHASGGDTSYVFVGCDDGSVWRYNNACGDFEQLVQDLHKGKALCVLSDNRGFYVAYENTEVVYFNLIDKTTKIFKAKSPLRVLQVLPDQEALVGYKGNSVVADEIFDLTTKNCYSAFCKSDEICGSVVIHGRNIVVAQGSRMYLSRISCESASCFVQCLTDGIPLSRVIIKDRDHNICGCITHVQQNMYYGVKSFLRASSLKKGVYVEAVDRYGVSYSFYIYDKLAHIDRVILYRDVSRGMLVCVYRKVGDKHFNHAYSVEQVVTRTLPVDIHAVLYSYNVPLIGACLIARAGTEHRRVIRGAKINERGFVWIFEILKSMAPYVLELVSREEVIKDEHHKDEMPRDKALTSGQLQDISYEWPILYLTKQSELFVQRLPNNRLQLTHCDETTGHEIHSYGYRPSAQEYARA